MAKKPRYDGPTFAPAPEDGESRSREPKKNNGGSSGDRLLVSPDTKDWSALPVAAVTGEEGASERPGSGKSDRRSKNSSVSVVVVSKSESTGEASTWAAKGRSLLASQEESFKRSRHLLVTETAFLREAQNIGTLGDKVSAAVLLLSRATLFASSAIDFLCGCLSSENRRTVMTAAAGARDVLVEHLLPLSRPLYSLEQRLAPLSKRPSDTHLFVWAFEDRLVHLVSLLIAALEKMAKDSIVKFRGDTAGLLGSLLAKPRKKRSDADQGNDSGAAHGNQEEEEEADDDAGGRRGGSTGSRPLASLRGVARERVLAVLVGMLNDGKSEVASRVMYSLLTVVDANPKEFKEMVTREVSAAALHVAAKPSARYFAVNTLASLRFVRDKDRRLAARCVITYLAVFDVVMAKQVEDKDMARKLTGALLAGAARAIPFAGDALLARISAGDFEQRGHAADGDGMKKQAVDYVDKFLGIVFSHTSTLQMAIQSLTLLFLLLPVAPPPTVASSDAGARDKSQESRNLEQRFYGALYFSLLRPEFLHSQKRQRQLLHLVRRAVLADSSTVRQAAFLHRLTAVSSRAADPALLCTTLALVSEVLQQSSVLRQSLVGSAAQATANGGGGKYNFADDDSSEEHFVDADQEQVPKATDKGKGGKKGKKEDLGPSYNPYEVDPAASNALSTPLWLLATFATHWHPSVRFFSRKICRGAPIDDMGTVGTSADDLKNRGFLLLLETLSARVFLERFVHKNPKVIKDNVLEGTSLATAGQRTVSVADFRSFIGEGDALASGVFVDYYRSHGSARAQARAKERESRRAVGEEDVLGELMAGDEDDSGSEGGNALAVDGDDSDGSLEDSLEGLSDDDSLEGVSDGMLAPWTMDEDAQDEWARGVLSTEEGEGLDEEGDGEVLPSVGLGGGAFIDSSQLASLLKDRGIATTGERLNPKKRKDKDAEAAPAAAPAPRAATAGKARKKRARS